MKKIFVRKGKHSIYFIWPKGQGQVTPAESYFIMTIWNMYSNFWVLQENCKQFWNGGFLNIVTKSIGKMKYSTKFI